MRLFKRLILLGFSLYAVTLASVTATSIYLSVVHGDAGSAEGQFDVLVVLSAGIDAQTDTLGPRSRQRVRTALAMMNLGKARHVLFSGGVIPPGPPSLAHRMHEMAVTQGFPTDRILLEPRSRTTWENIQFSQAILGVKDPPRILLLTDGFHLFRASMIAWFFDLDVQIASTPLSSIDSVHRHAFDLNREALAWWYNLGKAAAWTGLGHLGWTVQERRELIF